MKEKIEVREPDVPELQMNSEQKWISIKDFKPDGRSGDYAGRYLCIVERIMDKSEPFYKEGVFKTVELCYWNDLADRFQDSKNNWVYAPYWTQVPKPPEYKTIVVDRNVMIDNINNNHLWKQVSHTNESELAYLKDHYWNLNIAGIGYDETLYVSVVAISDGVSDYIYAVDNDKQIMNYYEKINQSNQ